MKKILKAKVEKILKELKEKNKKSINTIDSECTRINSLQGSHAGYNLQGAFDEKHGLIVNSDVVSENNVSAFIENSDKAEKIWINRVFVSRRSVEPPLFMSKNISLN